MSSRREVSAKALYDIIEQQRERLERFEDEMRELRRINIALERKLQEHTSRRSSDSYPYIQESSNVESTSTRWSKDEEITVDYRPPELTPYNGSPQAYEQGAPPVYERAKKHSDESLYYGRATQPHEAIRRGVEPPTPMARQNIDVGFVNQVAADELDKLPYGLIVLDARGHILFYNETESQYAGFDRERVVGKSFFGEVAPCTRVKEFQGRFDAFVRGELGRTTSFDFSFHFEKGTQDVLIYLSHGRRKGHINVMMMRQ